MTKLGFIGCGAMAQALAQGFCNAKLYQPQDILLSDRHPEKLAHMASLGYATATQNAKVVQSVDLVIVAVQPQTALAMLQTDVKPHWIPEKKLLISICAGITLDQLQSVLGSTERLARVMPNTCCVVGASATSFAVSSGITEDDLRVIKRLFQGVGRCYHIEEPLMHTMIAIAGSSPAYIFLLIEAMAEAGVKGGLPRELATLLAAQTVLGSAAMLLSDDQHAAAVLRADSDDADGPISAGRLELECHGFRSAVLGGVHACQQRSLELETHDDVNDPHI